MPAGSHSGSVEQLIAALKTGDRDAANQLGERYFKQMVTLARRRLGNLPRRAVDEEDVAISVLVSVLDGAAHGRFPQLADRDDLWKLIVVITHQKSVDLIRKTNAQARGGGNVRGDSVFAPTTDLENPGFDGFEDDGPTPEAAALMDEQVGRLLDRLGDNTLRQIAQLKLELHTNEEIAERQNISLSAVERKLRIIREKWESELIFKLR